MKKQEKKNMFVLAYDLHSDRPAVFAVAKKKTKITKILIIPFLGIVFLAGWILYFAGLKKEKKQPEITSSATDQEPIELMVIPPEEQTIKN